MPEPGFETDWTGAQTSVRLVTALPDALAVAVTLNGPAPAAAPASVLPSQSKLVVPVVVAPRLSVLRTVPLASWIVTLRSVASLSSSTAPAIPPSVRPNATSP